MGTGDWTPRLEEQLKRDLIAILDEVTGSAELQEVFSELSWPSTAVDQLKADLLDDNNFRRRLRARYAHVAERATSLDEHIRDAPPWFDDGMWWLPDSDRRRAFWLGVVVYPWAVAVAVSVLLMPAVLWLQVAFTILVAVAMYHGEPLTRKVMLPRGLSETTWRRLQWGRHRRKLRWGVSKLRYDWKKTVRDELVFPEIRQRINSGSQRTFSHKLTIRDASGLRASGALSFIITTGAVEHLRRELTRITSGAIALAGRRGVGKTTLLHALATGMMPEVHQADRLTVVVPAPARYELREFVLHLHTVICRAVLARIGGAGGTLPGTQDRWAAHYAAAGRRTHWRETAWHLVRATSFLLLGAAISGLLWYRDVATLPRAYVADLTPVLSAVFGSGPALHQPTSITELRRWAALSTMTLFVLAAAVNLLAIVAGPSALWAAQRGLVWIAAGRALCDRWRTSRAWHAIRRAIRGVADWLGLPWQPEPLRAPERRARTLTGIDEGVRLPQLDRSVRALALMAADQLRKIRFLQTHTSGWSGKIDAPKTLGLTVNRSIAHAEQPLTQPEVVDQLRDFLDRAAAVLIRAGEASGITIAIDELDKFADPAQAHEFVNDIKTVFGVENCVFLVSVSDDALASFERRGIPVRDALDSAFTTMIAVEPFTLEESQQWLDRQVIGLPTPFSCLCHCLSAGIPRELARSAAALDDLHREHRGIRLQEVTSRIIAADVAAKLRAFSHAAQQLPVGPAPSELIVTLNIVGGLTRPDTVALTHRLMELSLTLHNDKDDEANPDLTKLRHEAASFCYLSATLTELFSDTLNQETLTNVCIPGMLPHLETLAAARRALAVEPLLAWSMISTFRQQQNLAPLP